jgi:hypothetical protein
LKLSRVLYLLGGVSFLAALVVFLIALSSSVGLYSLPPPCGVQCTEINAAIWLVPVGLALIGAGAAWQLTIESLPKERGKARRFNRGATAILVAVLFASTSLYVFTTLGRPAGSCIPLVNGNPWSSNVRVGLPDGTIVAGTGLQQRSDFSSEGAVCFYNKFGILTSQFMTDRIIQNLAATSDGSFVVAGGYQLVGPIGAYQNGMVYLFRSDGEKVWNLSTGSFAVFNVQMNHDGSLIVFNDQGMLVTNLSGRILWRLPNNTQYTGVSATAIVGGGSAIAVAANGYIALLNAKGTVIWNHTIGFVQSPAFAASNSNIVVGTCESGFSGTVYYLDLNGNVIWSKYTSGCITSVKFADADSRILVQGNSGNPTFDLRGNILSNSTS